MQGTGLSVKAGEYLGKAEECFRAAETLKASDMRAAYMEMAKQWRELARQAMELDRERLFK